MTGRPCPNILLSSSPYNPAPALIVPQKLRNSVDHGIEAPEIRAAAGKPREGTVTLDAFHRGNSIVIEVRDDRKGLDADRILRKCLEKGLVTKADAEKMTPQQIYQKIWEPGLSTAETITEVSGRGMGMDIVKSKIEELSGTAEINSVSGQGTTITIKLPLTLAILPSLMVEIRGDVLAIPMETVVEIVSVARDQLSAVHGRQMACVRERVVFHSLNFTEASAMRAATAGEALTDNRHA